MSEPSEPGHIFVQAPVPPLDVDGLAVAIIGTSLFAVASMVLAVFHTALAAAGHGWWLGVAISGFGLGLVGLAYCYNRRLGRRAGKWRHN